MAFNGPVINCLFDLKKVPNVKHFKKMEMNVICFAGGGGGWKGGGSFHAHQQSREQSAPQKIFIACG